jgi:hypothetical protein
MHTFRNTWHGNDMHMSSGAHSEAALRPEGASGPREQCLCKGAHAGRAQVRGLAASQLGIHCQVRAPAEHITALGQQEGACWNCLLQSQGIRAWDSRVSRC